MDFLYIITIHPTESPEDQLDLNVLGVLESSHQPLKGLRAGNLLQRPAHSPYLLNVLPSLSQSIPLEVIVYQEQGLLERHVAVLSALFVVLIFS